MSPSLPSPRVVVLDARLRGRGAGGVEQVVIGLASGLSGLTDGEEQYLFLAHDGATEWLEPYLGGPCGLLIGPRRREQAAWKVAVRERLPWVYKLYHELSPRLRGDRMVRIPGSSGLIEAVGAGVMHFTTQAGFVTDVPTIYQPHDLQHVHLPAYFTPREQRTRDILYRGLCDQAAMVAVTASWGRQDLLDTFGLAPDKVRVCEWAPVLTAYPDPSREDLDRVRRERELPDTFVFYPARMWPHKNHETLLDAIALLEKEHGLHVPLVCTGSPTPHTAEVEARARRLAVTDRLIQLGFVSPLELQCLYRLSRCVCIPTRFEAASFPLWESFLAGAPAACSQVTSLPAQAGDAALVFDQEDPAAAAHALQRLWTDAALRDELVARARASVARFSWDRTARIFRAHYRRLAGWGLTDDDQAILDAPPLL